MPESPYSPSGHVSIQSVPLVNQLEAPHRELDKQLIAVLSVFLYTLSVVHVKQFVVDAPLHVKQESSHGLHLFSVESLYVLVVFVKATQSVPHTNVSKLPYVLSGHFRRQSEADINHSAATHVDYVTQLKLPPEGSLSYLSF